MSDKVTKRVFSYPVGYEPNLVIPKRYGPNRYVLSHLGQNNMAIMAMNPSSASEEFADATVSKVIKTAISMGYDGWIMFNIYPERATDQKNLDDFNINLHRRNVSHIIKVLKQNNIDEIWGAWGNLNHDSLKQSRDKWIKTLIKNNIKVYHFNELSKLNNPKHPLYLKIDINNKQYVNLEKLL